MDRFPIVEDAEIRFTTNHGDLSEAQEFWRDFRRGLETDPDFDIWRARFEFVQQGHVEMNVKVGTVWLTVLNDQYR
jgi:hypothetical protein